MLNVKLEMVSTLSFSMLCPQCANVISFDQPAFISAISRRRVFVCADCKNEFYFELICLTRAAEQRDEADGELAGKAPKELRTKDSVRGEICPSCEGSGWQPLNNGTNICESCEGTGQI